MPRSPKALARLALNTVATVVVGQLAVLGAWMTYLLLAVLAEGSRSLRTLPTVPDWLWGASLGAALLVLATQIYLYRTGAYDEENPLLKSREAFRREMIARSKATPPSLPGVGES